MKNMGDTIILTKEEYEEIEKRLNFLDALEAAGVDNWQGIDEAYALMDEHDE